MKKVIWTTWLWFKGLFAKQESAVKALPVPTSKHVVIYDLIKKTAGARHGRFNSSVGIIRKPL